MAVRGDSAEYLALEDYRDGIEDRIVNQASPDWFASELIKNNLITRGRSKDVMSRSHNSDNDRARLLLEAVITRIKHDHAEPEKPFQTLVEILEGEAVFKDLGQMLYKARQDHRERHDNHASKPSRRRRTKSESETEYSDSVADSRIPQHHLTASGLENECLRDPLAAFPEVDGTTVHSTATPSEESQHYEEDIRTKPTVPSTRASDELISGTTAQHHPVDNDSRSVIVVSGKIEQTNASSSLEKLDDIRDDIVKKDYHIGVLKSQLRDQSELHSEVRKLERRVTELTEEQEHLQSELQQVRSDSKAKVDSLESTVRSLESKLTSKTQELEESNQELQKCKRELEQKKDQLAQKEQELEDMKNDQSAAIEEAVTKREEEIKRIQASCEKLKNEKKDKEIELLKVRIESAEKIHDLKDELLIKEKEAAEFRAKIAEMNAEIKLKEKDNQILELEQKMGAEVFEVKRSNSEEMAYLRRRLSELEVQNKRKRFGQTSHSDSDYM